MRTSRRAPTFPALAAAVFAALAAVIPAAAAVNPPAAPLTATAYASSITYTWGANGNPAGTFYQIIVATDPAYSVVIATLSVAVTSVSATGLLPGTPYYGEVQSLSAPQTGTGFVALPVATTPVDARITSSSAPASPYVPLSGLVAAYQFDENTGTTTYDSAGYATPVTAGIQCLTNGCISTPTFVAGPPGFGSAIAFSGLADAAVRTLHGLNMFFPAAPSITLSAWVNPLTSAQPNGAGVAAIGPQNVDVALDISGGAFRFLIPNGVVDVPITVATATVASGQWTHVVGVYDSVNSLATLYLNGRPAAVLAGAPLRVPGGNYMSIGNRRNPSGVHAFPFSGSIDSVRVYNRALTAAEVLTDYSGGFVSSVTPSGANAGVIVALPPNAFGGPAQIFISADPLNHPIKIAPASLTAGISAPPSGLTMLPNSLIEVVPIVGGLPFTTALGSSATLSIPYADANRDNLIDGTLPPLAAAGAQMYTLNSTVNRWEALPTSVDLANRRVTGVTPHFSVFALFAPATVGTSLNAVRAYPVPWKPGSGGRFDAPGVTFANLPPSGRIRILTIGGLRVREFSYNGANAGSAVWDGFNDGGRRTASGVYFAKVVSDSDNSTILLKFAVER